MSEEKHSFSLTHPSQRERERERFSPTTQTPPAYLYSFETFSFMLQVIEAVIAVTIIAELSVCKTVTVSGDEKQLYSIKLTESE